MIITLSIGKAKVFPITATKSDGSLDTTSTAVVGTNIPSSIKVKLNPTNNREFGILAVAPTSGADVHVNVGAIGAPVFQVVISVPILVSVEVGADAGEVDPPDWLMT
jgi:hypothetical protein